jgi:hypothetical protein
MKFTSDVAEIMLIQIKLNSFKYSNKKGSKQPGKFLGQLDLRCHLISMKYVAIKFIIKSMNGQNWMKFAPEVAERVLIATMNNSFGKEKREGSKRPAQITRIREII